MRPRPQEPRARAEFQFPVSLCVSKEQAAHGLPGLVYLSSQ